MLEDPWLVNNRFGRNSKEKQFLDMERKMSCTWSELDAEPHRHGHHPVVYDMQRRHVVILFPQHEEESVEELGELGKVVPPRRLRHLQQKSRQ